MKKLFPVLALIVVIWCCMGFVGGPKYDVSYESVKVTSGLTLWDVAEKYYNISKPPMCFEAYIYEIQHLEANKAIFKTNRYLQIGDEIKVPMYKEIK